MPKPDIAYNTQCTQYILSRAICLYDIMYIICNTQWIIIVLMCSVNSVNHPQKLVLTWVDSSLVWVLTVEMRCHRAAVSPHIVLALHCRWHLALKDDPGHVDGGVVLHKSDHDLFHLFKGNQRETKHIKTTQYRYIQYIMLYIIHIHIICSLYTVHFFLQFKDI